MESALEYCRRNISESVNRYRRNVDLHADDCNVISHALQMYLEDVESEVELDGMFDEVSVHAAEELQQVRRLAQLFKTIAQPSH